MIEAAKEDQGQNDDKLLVILKRLEAESKMIEKDLGDINSKIVDLEKQRNDSRKVFDELSQDAYNPSTMDNLNLRVADQQFRADELSVKLKSID